MKATVPLEIGSHCVVPEGMKVRTRGKNGRIAYLLILRQPFSAVGSYVDGPSETDRIISVSGVTQTFSVENRRCFSKQSQV